MVLLIARSDLLDCVLNEVFHFFLENVVGRRVEFFGVGKLLNFHLVVPFDHGPVGIPQVDVPVVDFDLGRKLPAGC